MRRGELEWVLFMCVGSWLGGDEGNVGELPVEGLKMCLYTIGQKNHVLFPPGLKRVEKCTRRKIVLEKFLRTGVEGLT